MNATSYPSYYIATDIAVFGFDGRRLMILLIERGIEPYKGMWALPGGFMKPSETPEQAARRELLEETALEAGKLYLLGAYGDVDRDPRGRVVSVAYATLVDKNTCLAHAGDDARNTRWWEIDQLPPLAFDHLTIIRDARQRLRELVALGPSVLNLLDAQFTLSELQRLVEIITGTVQDRRNFQRRFMSAGVLVAHEPLQQHTQGRPATFYSISPDAIPDEDEELEKESPHIVGFTGAMPGADNGSATQEKPKKRKPSIKLSDLFKF